MAEYLAFQGVGRSTRPVGSILSALLVAATFIGPPAPMHTPDLTCRARNKAGQVVRSQARRRLFLRLSGFPKGRPGYVVDHIVPLCAGGCDLPANMFWQTVDEAKAKDRWEREVCAR